MLEFRCLKCFASKCGHFNVFPGQVTCSECHRQLVQGEQILKNFVPEQTVQQVSSPHPLQQAGGAGASASASAPDRTTGWIQATTPKVSSCCDRPFLVYLSDSSAHSSKHLFYDDFLRFEGFDPSTCCANHGLSTKTWKGRFNDCQRCQGTGGIRCQLRGSLVEVLQTWINSFMTGHTCTDRCHSLCLDCQGSGSVRVYESIACAHGAPVVRFTGVERDLLNFHVLL
jgi:hypothetical protein